MVTKPQESDGSLAEGQAISERVERFVRGRRRVSTGC